MPQQRAPRTKFLQSVYVLDIIIVGIFLLISHVHVDEARPPGEVSHLGARLHEARGLSTRRLGAASNNKNPTANSQINTHNDAKPQANNSPSTVLLSNKQNNAANGDDNPMFSTNDGGEISGDGSFEDNESSDDDNEEGDDDDYDEERNDHIDPGSGSHESKYSPQPSSPHRFPSDRPPSEGLGDKAIITTINSTRPDSTIIGANKPSTNKQTLPTTTNVPVVVSTITEIPTNKLLITTTTFAPSPISTTSAPNLPVKDDTTLTSVRPWSFDKDNITKLPNSSIFDNDYEDEEEEDEDDDDDSNSNFEDNIPPEIASQSPIHNIPSSSSETNPNLETISTQATTSINLTTMTNFPIEVTTSTTTSKPTTTASISLPTNIGTISTTTKSPTNEDELDNYDSSDNINEDEDDDNDDDDEDEDDVDELEDIDSDISELATTLSPSMPEKEITEYPDIVKIKIEESLTITTMAPTTFRPTAKSDIFTTQRPPVIMDSRIDESNTVQEIYPNLVSRQKYLEFRSLPFFAQPILILLILGGTVTGLFVAILIVMFIVYKLRRQEEI